LWRHCVSIRLSLIERSLNFVLEIRMAGGNCHGQEQAGSGAIRAAADEVERAR
jgi:hypothetical protein